MGLIIMLCIVVSNGSKHSTELLYNYINVKYNENIYKVSRNVFQEM